MNWVESIIAGQEHLKSYITNYYQNLFGASKDGNFSMDVTRTDDISQISMEEDDLFTAEYSEEGVRKAVFQIKQNKAPGPDGFPAEFYQIF
jgi:hypothetical protein